MRILANSSKIREGDFSKLRIPKAKQVKVHTHDAWQGRKNHHLSYDFTAPSTSMHHQAVGKAIHEHLASHGLSPHKRSSSGNTVTIEYRHPSGHRAVVKMKRTKLAGDPNHHVEFAIEKTGN